MGSNIILFISEQTNVFALQKEMCDQSYGGGKYSKVR